MKKIFSTVAMTMMALFAVVTTANASTDNEDEKDIAFLHCKQGTPYDVCMKNLADAYGASNIEKSIEDGGIKVLSVEDAYFKNFHFDEIKFCFDKSKLVSVRLSKSFSDANLKHAVEFRDELFNFLSQKYKATKKRIPNFQNLADYGLGYKAHEKSFDYPLFIFLSECETTTTTDGKAPVVEKSWDLQLTYWVNDYDDLHEKYEKADNY